MCRSHIYFATDHTEKVCEKQLISNSFQDILRGYLENLEKKCQGMGIPIRGEHLFTLCFADDQVVIAQDEEDLGYMMRRLKEEYERAGLEINLDKTEYLQTNCNFTQNLAIDGNTEIKGANKFKYS
ncbi:hypothetical protein LSTR_LSTR007966 [Laodelphax striatellus]|uniref:Reverse transcriptase domain-containing protein n=1 Tax=Laodelphax striatellus TaxID=195883 RepID=A0A482WI94_LAOST|nr:hypothetical protein LSTR_LSTR007966 [Laodelphax striatellus]